MERLTYQPPYPARIDASDPIGSRARFVLIGSIQPELVNGVQAAGTIGAAEATAGGTAYILPSAGTNWAAQIPELDPYISGSFSIFWHGILRADTAQTLLRCSGASFGWALSTTGYDPTRLQIFFSAIWRGTGFAVLASIADNTLHTVRMDYDAEAATIELFLDGVSLGSSSSWFLDPGAMGSGQTFSMSGDATKPHKVITVQAFAGKRSDGDIPTLFANPWHIFEPEDDEIDVIAGGAASNNLTGASSIQSNAAAYSAITQDHALAAANPAQPNSGSVPAITQDHTIVGVAAAQGNLASAGSITQYHVLSVQTSAQSNSAVADAITQAHTLAVAGSSQANAASTAAISLGVAHDLSAAASSQANAGASDAISQAHILVCAPSVQDNIAAASPIVQAHVLGSANSSQANAGSAASIIIGSAEITSIVEKTAVFRATVSRTTKFQRSKSVTVRLN